LSPACDIIVAAQQARFSLPKARRYLARTARREQRIKTQETRNRSLRIRPVGDDDVDALVRLSLLAWEPVFSSFEQILGPAIYAMVYPDWRASQREAVEKVCQDGGKTVVWVGEVDGVVVGFVAYELYEDKTGEVQLLAVHPAHQNLGVGTERNNWALTKMKASRTLSQTVGVLSPNSPESSRDMMPNSIEPKPVIQQIGRYKLDKVKPKMETYRRL
jgi:GNAT superfamily N-acetyltransferase